MNESHLKSSSVSFFHICAFDTLWFSRNKLGQINFPLKIVLSYHKKFISRDIWINEWAYQVYIV